MQYSSRGGVLPFKPLSSTVSAIPGRWGQSPSAPYTSVHSPEWKPSSGGITRPESLEIEIVDEKDKFSKRPPSGSSHPSTCRTKAIILDTDSIDDVQKNTDDPDYAEDMDDEEIVVADKENPVPEDLKLEKFDSIFQARAPDGYLTADRLPALMIAGNCTSTDSEINAVIKRILGKSYDPLSKVQYEQAVEIYKRLMIPQDDSVELVDGDVKEANCLARWAESISDSKATNVLLFIVVGVSFVSAFLVAGLAILFMWNESYNTLSIHMLEDLGTMKDVLDVFDQEIYVGEVQQRAREISTLLGTVTSHVAYRAVLESDKKNLVYMATFLAQGVAAWWEYQPEKAYINVAKVMGIWTDQVMTAEGREQAFDIVDNIVDLLPEKYEILLGTWTDATNTSVQYVTRFRMADQCVDKICDAAAHGVTFSPMKAAMLGMEGAMRVLDYRPHEVFVGFSSVSGLGVEYKADIEVIDDSKYSRLQDYFDTQNANAIDSREFMIGRIDGNGNSQLLTKLKFCDASCIKHALRQDGPLGRALQNQIGSMETIGYMGAPVIAAYTPIPSTNLGLVVQMLKADRLEAILASVTRIIETINAKLLKGSEEVELSVMRTVNNTNKLQHLTKFKFAHQCPTSGCLNMTEYLEIPIKNCSRGAIKTTDYRGVSVYAGYFCMPEFNAYLSMKVDDTQVDEEMMEYILRFIDQRNQFDKGTTYEFLAAQAREGLSPQEVKGFKDFKLLSQIKNPEHCFKADCSWDSNSIMRTLQNKAGDLPAISTDTNYANRAVTAAMEFNSNIGGGVGLVLELDYQDFIAPAINTALILLLFTLGMAIFTTGILVVMTKKMMRSMITASVEGKKAVEKEKEQFSALVASMYPKYVVPRLLAGERHIVGHIKHTAVFFSDIYEFTSASNTISPEELIQFMGYTYGVMDDIADRYGVYKVKTVGDAYLAISGLPGIEPGSGSKDCCLDMLKFASCVAQIFSHRFNHPEKGKILTVVAGTMSWNKKKRRMQASSKAASDQKNSAPKGSVAPTSSVADGQSAWTGKNTTEVESAHQSIHSGGSRSKAVSSVRGPRGGTPQVQCIMSYGIATGPVTAGVLQGKSPMFDIWGKTVNLASRMETTGQPGRIQVSEHFFRKIAAVPNQPFAFEHGHKAYCKGFGAVNSYFVRSSSEPPPKDLMIQLGLEPRYGLFYFDNVLNGLQRNTSSNAGGPGAPGAAASCPSAAEETHSMTSSHSSQRMQPHVSSPGTGGLDLVDYDDA